MRILAIACAIAFAGCASPSRREAQDRPPMPPMPIAMRAVAAVVQEEPVILPPPVESVTIDIVLIPEDVNAWDLELESSPDMIDWRTVWAGAKRSVVVPVSGDRGFFRAKAIRK
jgi:hypothetical protein